MLCLRPSSQISYELPSQLIFSDTFRHTERLFVFTWGCEVVIRDGAALPHSLCRLQRVTWPGRCGGGVCFLYGRWTGLSSSLCCESAQCWILTMFPLCSVRLHAEKLHLFVFSLHSHSLCVRLRVRVCACVCVCTCACVCVPCRWRSPKTKCTWVRTAWCSTCRTKRTSGESELSFYPQLHFGRHDFTNLFNSSSQSPDFYLIFVSVQFSSGYVSLQFQFFQSINLWEKLICRRSWPAALLVDISADVLRYDGWALKYKKNDTIITVRVNRCQSRHSWWRTSSQFFDCCDQSYWSDARLWGRSV